MRTAEIGVQLRDGGGCASGLWLGWFAARMCSERVDQEEHMSGYPMKEPTESNGERRGCEERRHAEAKRGDAKRCRQTKAMFD